MSLISLYPPLFGGAFVPPLMYVLVLGLGGVCRRGPGGMSGLLQLLTDSLTCPSINSEFEHTFSQMQIYFLLQYNKSAIEFYN